MQGAVSLVIRAFLFQVHTACKESLVTKCPLGLCKVSVIPPTALNSIDSDGGCHVLSWPVPFFTFLSPCLLLPHAPMGCVGEFEMLSGRGQARSSGGEELCTDVVSGVRMASRHA